MQKVIFVASTSYSGSTFLDMTLGNDPKGLSIGEVNALFEPVKRHHYNPVCGCHQKNCNIWKDIRNQPASELYKTLFERNPDIEFIVDSSKSPLWIHKRIKDLIKQGIEYRIALIWKTPLEIAHSFAKRSDYDNWERSWVNYHRMLYSLQPDNWVTVSYRDYASNPESLALLCQSLGIPYFKGKEQFWEKPQHILFGNHSARKHLLRTHADNQEPGAIHEFQKIHYKAVDDPELEKRVSLAMEANPMIGDIQAILESLTHGRRDAADKLHNISMSVVDTELRKLQHGIKLVKGKFLSPRIDNTLTGSVLNRLIQQDDAH